MALSASPAAADTPLAHAAAGGEERVLVLLPAQDYRAPDIEVLAGDSPRVVVDFSGIPAWGGPAVLEVDSPLLRRVRAWLHSDERRLRVVLDLAADPSGLLVSHTYEPENGAVRAAIILLPAGPRQE
ncbi:MAG: hypothetical protein AB1916_10140 [Thermodesulfobacteriota bacterium]